ncbi:MAG: hypothetical protein JNM85_09860 [Chthonomonas sp.]|nr:hypothetical protein [Chthonomonas sp.]
MRVRNALIISLTCAVIAPIAFTQVSPVPEPPKTLGSLPESAKAVKELQPLAFMAGRWIGKNPNGTVNEEHWMTPRGNNMIGTFRQLRRDGFPALIEISLVQLTKDGVELRLRHLHSGLEIPKNREEHDTFKLRSADKNRAEFYGTGKAAPVTSVVYRLLDKNRLVVDTNFAPETGEKGYTLVYFREGSK